MRSHIQIQVLFFAGIVGILISAVAVFFLIHTNTSSQAPQSKLALLGVVVSLPKPVAGLPIHLRIPRINVDATIEHLGVTASGNMDVPKGPDDAAWFDLGPLPGEIGAAVIAGHEGWKNGMRAVFDDLHNLKKGDKIIVQDDNGAMVTFIVRETRIYGENENAGNVFESTDGKAHLNLITCEGIWNAASKSYSGRLVVFADKE